MEISQLCAAIGSTALLIAAIVFIIRFFSRHAGCLFALLTFALACVAASSKSNSGLLWVAAGVAALLWVVALVRQRNSRRAESSPGFSIQVEGVEAPRRRRRKTPPEITPERMFSQCAKILGDKVIDREALRSEISRIMNSAKFSDWARANNDVYFEDATPRQIGYLQALGYSGPLPRYLGDASFLIECVLVVKSYREKLTSAPPTPVSSDVRADYIALWNSATAAGVLSKRDATELLKVVMSSPDSAARHALISAISDYLAAPDIAEIPADLFTLSESWLDAQ